MASRQYKFHDGEKGTALAIRVKQSRKKSCFSKVLRDGTVVVQLKHETGDVNKRLIDFLSQELYIPLKRFQIIAGDDGNKKLISIIGMAPNQIQKRILEMIS